MTSRTARRDLVDGAAQLRVSEKTFGNSSGPDDFEDRPPVTWSMVFAGAERRIPRADGSEHRHPEHDPKRRQIIAQRRRRNSGILLRSRSPSNAGSGYLGSAV